MLFNTVTRMAMLFGAHTLAQTTTDCNPTEKTCPANTGLTSTYTHDFTTGADTSNWNITAGNVSYTSSGAEFTITQSGDSPTIRSNWYIFFGRVSFILKAAPGTGIVSSAILQSDDLDEVDWEWIGGSSEKVQSNYFGKGNTTSYDRAVWHAASATQTTAHNYTIVWTEASTIWYIDGVSTRTLAYADALDGKNYPQTPMDVRIGIWSGGDASNSEGTIEWAGGSTDYTDGPFTMTLQSIEVENYNPASTYTYGDLTGDYDSIVLGAAVNGSATGTAASSGLATALAATATETPETTKAASKRTSDGQRLGAFGWQYAAVMGAFVALWCV